MPKILCYYRHGLYNFVYVSLFIFSSFGSVPFYVSFFDLRFYIDMMALDILKDYRNLWLLRLHVTVGYEIYLPIATLRISWVFLIHYPPPSAPVLVFSILPLYLDFI